MATERSGTHQGDSVITFDSISKSFGEEEALRNVSFSMSAGETVALMGPNGSGKSTLLRILLGLQQSDSGQALIHGRRYADLDSPTSVIGVALDSPVALPTTTARSHLRRQCRLLGVPMARADELLVQVGLADAGKKKLEDFSLGMTKRLSLATALVSQPPILVLDEPFNGLDPHGIEWLQDLILAHSLRGGSLLVTSHRLTELDRIADQVVIISTEVLHQERRRRGAEPSNLDEKFFAHVGETA